jgi:hypothetical protein
VTGPAFGTTRVFVLVRDRDPSGVSGTGVVAEGAVWSDGSASLRWRGSFPSIVFWPDGVPAILAVHGHGGATKVRYEDDQTREEPTASRPTAPPLARASAPDDHQNVGGFCGCCGSVAPCSAMRRGPRTSRQS